MRFLSLCAQIKGRLGKEVPSGAGNAKKQEVGGRAGGASNMPASRGDTCFAML